jgi:hypothetical protein
MDDERELLEVDSRVRAALRADADACRRVVSTALTDTRLLAPHRWRVPIAIAIAMAVLLIVGAAGFRWRRSAVAARAPSLTITSAGPMLVVEGRDGRRWVIGRTQPRRSGNYVMVVTE